MGSFKQRNLLRGSYVDLETISRNHRDWFFLEYSGDGDYYVRSQKVFPKVISFEDPHDFWRYLDFQVSLLQAVKKRVLEFKDLDENYSPETDIGKYLGKELDLSNISEVSDSKEKRYFVMTRGVLPRELTFQDPADFITYIDNLIRNMKKAQRVAGRLSNQYAAWKHGQRMKKASFRRSFIASLQKDASEMVESAWRLKEKGRPFFPSPRFKVRENDGSRIYTVNLGGLPKFVTFDDPYDYYLWLDGLRKRIKETQGRLGVVIQSHRNWEESRSHEV